MNRLQQLAGINEWKIKPSLWALFSQVWDSKSEEYLALVGTDPIYDGLDKVINNPNIKTTAFKETKEYITQYYKDTNDEENEDSNSFSAGFASDSIDYTIMLNFTPQLAKNLIKVGFKYDEDEDIWTIPLSYFNNLPPYVAANNFEKVATSYGIIWDFFNYDYDTNVRETIGDFLTTAAQEVL